jgi:glucosamine--fructose-6-phosphate aminotransferase (isomerizing)
MCGITGIVSEGDICQQLYESMQRLEYRGYDSAGMAVLTNAFLEVRKDAGKIAEVNRRQRLSQMYGQVGIAHTRWATHGGVTQQNSHPHVSMDKQFAIVHNGIIENYIALRQELQHHGFHFSSETDSEVIVHLISYYFQRGMGVEEALVTATHRLEGAFAFALVTAKAPDTLFCARMESPLVIGVGDQSLFLASDVNAFAAYTRQAVYLNDGEYALLQAHNYQVKSLQTTKVVTRDAVTIEWNGDQGATKGHYPHYMVKEIHEGAACIDAAMDIPEADINELAQRMATHQRSFLTGVGTAYYVAQMAQYYFSSVANYFIPAISADELPSLAQPGPQDLTLAISQSGETYDTLKALRYTKLRGGGTAAVVNVPGSSMVREVDQAILQGAGPEICVLSTKSTISQIAIMIRVALALAHQRAIYSDDTYAMCTHMLRELPLTLQHVYAELMTVVRQLAQTYCHIEHWFFIGRGIYSAVAMESALKFKEVSYLHAEGMSGGFLKHGTIALIDDRTHSLAFIPHPDEHALFNATLTNIQEIRARGGLVIGIHQQKDESLSAILDHEIVVPQTPSLVTPLVYLTAGQMLAYHTGLALGRNIDKPRALAKSVTVA